MGIRRNANKIFKIVGWTFRSQVLTGSIVAYRSRNTLAVSPTSAASFAAGGEKGVIDPTAGALLLLRIFMGLQNRLIR